MSKLIYIAAGIFTIYFLLPLYILLMIAFSPAKYTIESVYPPLYFKGFTLSNLIYAFTQYDFISPFFKSLAVATLVGIVALIIGIPAGYGLSRLPGKVAYPVLILLLITNMVPGIVVAIPISAEFIKLGLYDSIPGLAFVQELITLPLAVFILQGTFSTVSRDIEYQAKIDGASTWSFLKNILLPIASPGIAAAFLISWMFSWDEFTYAVILSPIHPTLPIEIYINITRGNELAAVAFSLVFTIPVIILTIALQKYLKGEYLTGGLKS
ncbi:carbohydrate ABC transporter permease [Acidianus manzaensis]|uniref:Sugar ABC transporter permease n=1 Tax=Acidianus manzaensis TaxID=282676 RepID=A0A1W6JWY6_9CREN|nr:carbohydrate ABC transporter permease [Acidianus manzaensis]ARM74740.1 sugar ABC transporter permease [Acidianus manzaensis]